MRWPAGSRGKGSEIKALLCVLAACLAWAAEARPETRPQYGGVLRAELRASSVTLQPLRWKAGSADLATNVRMAELVFDRLVSLDNYGRFQPQLATEWAHDGSARQWQFTLRQGVKFSDGTLLTASDVVAALQPVLPRGMQMRTTPAGVAIHCATSAPDLLEVLASGPSFVYKDDGSGGLPVGTGPFVAEGIGAGATDGAKSNGDGAGSPALRLRFRFNDLCWSGRPYLDAIEVTLNVAPLRALLDLQLGKTDLAELSVDTIKRAQQSNLRSWVSAPLTLYALRFSGDSKRPDETPLREAIGLSVDREAMARVLLQKEAEPASALLPQWLSGYAFLFETESNVERAKGLRSKFPVSGLGVARPLRVNVDGANELSRLIGERIVVNARSAGLTLQAAKGSAKQAGDGSDARADGEAQLIAWRYDSLSPSHSLESLALALHWQLPEGGVPSEVEARYAWEKRMIDEKSVLPIVAVPDFVAVDARVRNWSPSSWGEWRLEDVWLERGEAANGARGEEMRPAAGAKP